MFNDRVGVWHSFNCVTNLEPVFSWRQVFHLVTQIFGEHRLSRVLGHENVFFFKTITMNFRLFWFLSWYEVGPKIWLYEGKFNTLLLSCWLKVRAIILSRSNDFFLKLICSLDLFLLHRGYRWRFWLSNNKLCMEMTFYVCWLWMCKLFQYVPKSYLSTHPIVGNLIGIQFNWILHLDLFKAQA